MYYFDAVNATGDTEKICIVKTADGNKIAIHYVYNKVTGTFDDFKFK